MADVNDRQHTRVAHNAPAATPERKTEFYSGVESTSPSRSVADNRKIVGVLVSYTWDPCGKLYEVRQGRTHIGAGEIRGEDRIVDVQCTRDRLLSADHAMILVQGGQFYIQDLSSVNGTVVDGKPIRPESAEPLASPAEIKTGETVFTFVRFDAVPSGPVPQVEDKVPTSRAKTELI
jgi:hypothetical protein